jgi:hypothetical protein
MEQVKATESKMIDKVSGRSPENHELANPKDKAVAVSNRPMVRTINGAKSRIGLRKWIADPLGSKANRIFTAPPFRAAMREHPHEQARNVEPRASATSTQLQVRHQRSG